MSKQNKSTESNNVLDLEKLEELEQVRLKKLFAFLLSKTDLGIDVNLSKQGNSTKSAVPNESLIAVQWGLSDYRVFVRRVLRSIPSKLYKYEKKGGEKEEKVPSLDLYRLIKILVALEEYTSSNTGNLAKGKKKSEVSPKFTKSDKLKSLFLFSELSEYEREVLKISMNSNGRLVEKLLDKLENIPPFFQEDLLSSLYKDVTFCNVEDLSSSIGEKIDKKTDKKIKSIVKPLLSDRLNISDKILDEEVEKRTKKIIRELERILSQSGLQQIPEVIGTNSLENEIDNLSDDIVSKLSKSLVDNESVTQELPIFIKWIDMKRVRPLPLRIYDQELDREGLLNKRLIDDAENRGILGLDQQIAYCVTVHFQISNEGRKTDFCEKATGIGSPLSLATSAINRFLLWDIPCLKDEDIFPVAKEIFINSEILGKTHGTSAHCHTVIELCKCSDIQSTINAFEKDGEVVNVYGECAHGDFCAFDVLEIFVKARFMARLRAIQNLRISPDKYITELENKIKEQNAVREAKKYLKFYPFSRWAMEGTLEEKLFENKTFQGKYRRKLSKVEFEEVSDKPWSLVAYDAHLTIAESLLIEGKQKAAKCYLDFISDHVRKNRLSDLICCKYYYLMAYYYYLYDLKGQALYSNQVKSIAESLKFISEAKRCLDSKVRMCQVVNDLSQSNSHPFFDLFSKLYYLEARIYLGFFDYVPKEADKSGSKFRNISLVLSSLEKARICAAKDGNPDGYAIYSLFQSRIYSMLASLGDDSFLHSLGLDIKSCLDWGKRLLDHAIVCSIDTGNKSYSDLKFYAGNANQEFNGTKIMGIPLIIESEESLKKVKSLYESPLTGVLGKKSSSRRAFSDLHPLQQRRNPDLLTIPSFSTLFKAEPLLGQEDSITYLFGSHSCNIFLTRGVQILTEIHEENTNFKASIEKALNNLIIAWATAKDGASSKSNVHIERNFKSPKNLPPRYNISSIQGLYPHRISQTVLSSTFMILLCEILRMIYLCEKKEDKENEIDDFNKVVKFFLGEKDKNKGNLYEGTEAGNSETMKSTGQERFNGHLDDHTKNIKAYYFKVIDELTLNSANKDRDTTLYNHMTWKNTLIKNLLYYISGKNGEV
jgi:hypothetical protein